MRAIIQRVEEASVKVDNKTVASIDKGYLILLGVHINDTEDDLAYIFKKTVDLRIFNDEKGLMNMSIEDINGDILVVSQFTLYGDARKGKRPSFSDSADKEKANRLYESYVSLLKTRISNVQTGIFAADMKVSLVNDGPVTIQLDSSKIY